MIHYTEEGIRFSAELTEQLRWLEENHPELTAMILLGKTYLDTLRQAGEVAERDRFVKAMQHDLAVYSKIVKGAK